jgi:hypothetical protein
MTDSLGSTSEPNVTVSLQVTPDDSTISSNSAGIEPGAIVEEEELVSIHDIPEEEERECNTIKSGSVSSSPKSGDEKLTWLPDEYRRYRFLCQDPGYANLCHTTVRYRLPRNWNPETNTNADITKAMLIVNSVNNTWYNYHLTRLLPDWLIVSIDLRQNGYHSPNLTGDTNPSSEELRDTYIDLEFCFQYFSLQSVKTVVLYGYQIGALAALGFYHKFVKLNPTKGGHQYRVTHLILNSPQIEEEPSLSRAVLSKLLFTPLSYLFPSTTQTKIVDKLYDSSATVACMAIPSVISLATGSGMGSFAILATTAIVTKNLLNTTVGQIVPDGGLQTLGFQKKNTTLLPKISEQFRNFMIEAGTIQATKPQTTLIFGRSIRQLQDYLHNTGTFITCPTLALFQKKEVNRPRQQRVFYLLQELCVDTPLIQELPNVFEDTLLADNLPIMAKSAYSLLLWMQSNGIELKNEVQDTWDLTTASPEVITMLMCAQMAEAFPSEIKRQLEEDAISFRIPRLSTPEPPVAQLQNHPTLQNKRVGQITSKSPSFSNRKLSESSNESTYQTPYQEGEATPNTQPGLNNNIYYNSSWYPKI